MQHVNEPPGLNAHDDMSAAVVPQSSSQAGECRRMPAGTTHWPLGLGPPVPTLQQGPSGCPSQSQTG